MAQSVEHVLGKDEVAGSIPANSSKSTHFGGCFYFYIEVFLGECYTVKRNYWKGETCELVLQYRSEGMDRADFNEYGTTIHGLG